MATFGNRWNVKSSRKGVNLKVQTDEKLGNIWQHLATDGKKRATAGGRGIKVQPMINKWKDK